jgi:hypothetical protein
VATVLDWVLAPLDVDVDVSGCGDGSYALTDGFFPWQKNELPSGQPTTPEEEACYNAYFEQLGGAGRRAGVAKQRHVCSVRQVRRLPHARFALS